MSASVSDYENYDIAAAVLYGLTIPPLIVLSIFSLVAIHRRNDPLRLPFVWLKLAIAVFIISAALNTASLAIAAAINFLDGDFTFALIEASWRISDLSTFFSNLADNITLLCLVELALSFLRGLGNDGIYQQIIRYSNLVVLIVLFALTFAMEGTNEEDITKSDYGSNIDVSWTTVNNLYGAYYILYWIFSLPVVILSAIVLYGSIRKKHLQSLAACFLAASLVNLTRTTWDMAFAIQYDINYDPFSSIVPLYTIVLNPILYTWFTVVLFGLLVFIGFKKTNGLWSQQQQFYGGGQGQGIPNSQPIGASSYMPSSQPVQTAIIGGVSPNNGRSELTGANYTYPNQQYYGTQNQQQPQMGQNQVTQMYGVAGTQNARV